MFQDGAKYDLKTRPDESWPVYVGGQPENGYKYYIFNGQVVRGDAPGNILYGYIGGRPFNDWVLYLGGDKAAGGLGKDDPYDKKMIGIGIDYYKAMR
jgi:hypothetical protein